MISKVLILAGIFASGAMAQLVTLNMGEVPFQPVNNLVVTKGGISFTFTDTTGADYNASDGGQETYTQDPTIEGQTTGEVLTVAYSVPVYTIHFGLTFSAISLAVPTLATVALYNSNSSVVPFATYPVTATLADTFEEGQFNYFGAPPLGPVTKMTVTMNSAAASAFGFDNLAVNPSPASVPAATPATLTLTALCLAAIAVFLQRKQLLA